MKETHLIGFILTYIAFFVSKQSKVYLTIKQFENFNEYIIFMISLLPVFFVHNMNGVDHIFRILSFCSGYISLKNIINGEKSKIKDYIHSVFLTGMLVSIYNNSILRKYTLLLYVLYATYIALLTSNKLQDLSTLMNDSILTHLIFFFTKN